MGSRRIGAGTTQRLLENLKRDIDWGGAELVGSRKKVRVVTATVTGSIEDLAETDLAASVYQLTLNDSGCTVYLNPDETEGRLCVIALPPLPGGYYIPEGDPLAEMCDDEPGKCGAPVATMAEAQKYNGWSCEIILGQDMQATTGSDEEGYSPWSGLIAGWFLPPDEDVQNALYRSQALETNDGGFVAGNVYISTPAVGSTGRTRGGMTMPVPFSTGPSLVGLFDVYTGSLGPQYSGTGAQRGSTLHIEIIDTIDLMAGPMRNWLIASGVPPDIEWPLWQATCNGRGFTYADVPLLWSPWEPAYGGIDPPVDPP